MNTYDLFISHSWSYSTQYNNLTTLLYQRSYFNYKNHSIPEYDPIHTNGTDKELYKAIYDKMYNCHVVLILAGVYATYSKWIDKEIKIAKNEFLLAKPIIAIEPWGSERTSQKVKDNADKVVKWNVDSIINAIRELRK